MKKILIVGYGKMGSALVSGWIDNDIKNISIIEPCRGIASYAHKTKRLSMLSPYNFYQYIEELPENYSPDYIIFAIKPQQADNILPQYKKIISDNTVIISIMAGKTIASIDKCLSNSVGASPCACPNKGSRERLPLQQSRATKIIRVMPNTPALIGKGVSAGFASNEVSEEQKTFCEKLFHAVGKFYWVNDEKLMDSVTAISGSGPAYVFYFIECLTNAGIEIGLPEKLAKELAIQTVVGSSLLAEQSEETVEQLRKNVTSPNGTTQAGLDVLMNGLFSKQIINTAKSAKKRSEELSE